MRISTKTSVALHILVALAVVNDERLTNEMLARSVNSSPIVTKDQKMTSDVLAQSTGSNSVVIRNILGKLKKAGIIKVQRGTGGASLLLAPTDITIWMVYQAVDDTPLEEIIGVHPSPSPSCPVGKYMKDLLEEPYTEVTYSVKNTMQAYTLQYITDNYFAKIGICKPNEKETPTIS